jgi:hypothetical protein
MTGMGKKRELQSEQLGKDPAKVRTALRKWLGRSHFATAPWITGRARGDGRPAASPTR